MTENELYHHGILGMKWGVRRYQNKDGSLTPRGRKRLEQLESEADKLRGNKDGGQGSGSSSSSVKYKRSDAAELPDEELNARIKRLDLERRYKDALPKEQEHRSKGKVFVQDILNPALKEGAKNLTKKIVNNAVDAIGDTVGKKVKGSIEGSLKAKLGLKDEVTDASSYKLSDISKLTTKQLQERNSRLAAEKAYKGYLDSSQTKQQNNNQNQSQTNQQNNNQNQSQTNQQNNNQSQSQTNQQNSNQNQSQTKQQNNNQNQSQTNQQKKDYTNDAARPLVKVEKPITARISEWSRHDEGMSGGKVTRREASLENLAKGRDAIKAKREASAAETIRKAEESAMMERAKSFVDRFDFDEEYKKLKHSDTEDLKMEVFYSDELYHHGIKGQKWGVRRFQNPDGTLTEAGRARGARTYNKALRREDRQRAYAVGRLQFANYANKMNPTSDSKKAVSAAKSDIENRKARAKRLVSQAIKDGYTVKTKDIARGTSKLKEWGVRTTWAPDKTNYYLQELNNMSYTSNGNGDGYGTARARTGMLSYTPGTAYKVRKKK